MTNSFRTVLLSILLLGSLAAHAQNAVADSVLKKLKARVDAISTNKDLAHAQWGFALLEGTTGTTLFQHRASETMIPASTQKTITSAAALGILGEDFTFKTALEHDGKIENGNLKGNLIIRGGGDPTLGSDRYKWGTDMQGVISTWVENIRKKGITAVQGQVIGDAEIFEDAMLPASWNWGDIGNYYGSGACGLTFMENTYQIVFDAAGKVGETAKFLRTEPAMPDLEFVNEMKTGAAGSGDNGYVYGAPYTALRYLRGTIPQGKGEFTIKGSLSDPALFTAQMLKTALDSAGIKVIGGTSTLRALNLAGKRPTEARQVIHVHQSPALKDIIYWLNKKSINLYAEHLVKMVGVVKYRDGSTESGLKAIGEYWAAKGVDIEGLHMYDGSGLSRYNGVTPMQLAKMMQVNIGQKYFESFYNSLPIAGNSNDPGTIKSMGVNTAAANNVRAKSGFIARVRCYTGYASTRSGKRVCFAMMANNYTCSNNAMRDLFSDLMVAIAELP